MMQSIRCTGRASGGHTNNGTGGASIYYAINCRGVRRRILHRTIFPHTLTLTLEAAFESGIDENHKGEPAKKQRRNNIERGQGDRQRILIQHD